jgi:hypothetical protein
MNERAELGLELAVELNVAQGDANAVCDVLERVYRLRRSDEPLHAVPGDNVLRLRGAVPFELEGLLRRQVCYELANTVERTGRGKVDFLDVRFGRPAPILSV